MSPKSRHLIQECYLCRSAAVVECNFKIGCKASPRNFLEDTEKSNYIDNFSRSITQMIVIEESRQLSTKVEDMGGKRKV